MPEILPDDTKKCASIESLHKRLSKVTNMEMHFKYIYFACVLDRNSDSMHEITLAISAFFSSLKLRPSQTLDRTISFCPQTVIGPLSQSHLLFFLRKSLVLLSYNCVFLLLESKVLESAVRKYELFLFLESEVAEIVPEGISSRRYDTESKQPAPIPANCIEMNVVLAIHCPCSAYRV